MGGKEMDEREKRFWEFVHWTEAFDQPISIEKCKDWISRHHKFIGAKELLEDVDQFIYDTELQGDL
jgi:hypothetical protein